MNEQENEIGDESEEVEFVSDETTEKSLGDDVFGLLTHAESTNLQVEVVIVKSKAIAKMLADGMDEEEAEEHWEYNIAGSYGSGSYSCVDDMVDPEILAEILENEDGEICDPPYTGRAYIKKPYLSMYEILHKDISDSEKVVQMMKFVSDFLK